MSSSGFSSTRPDCFPAGLRVLVVDDDLAWVKIIEKMLKKCNYEVTSCNLAYDALDLLRERKGGFDIVISDVNMPDMDGFKLLEHVGLEMDLPVIMMSIDGETSRVMKGVQHGACDYLLKPIRMKELRNIWQHVFRKRIHEVRDIEDHESLEEIQRMRNGTEYSDDSYMFGEDVLSGKKRKDTDNGKNDDRVMGESSYTKKSRVVWSPDLHQQFLNAVDQIGFDKLGPKKILDVMALPWLTRENVASHLQKYRLYLIRREEEKAREEKEEKEKERKAALVGIEHSNLSSEDPSANVCLQDSVNSSTLQPAHKTVIHMDNSKICKRNMRGIHSMGESVNPLYGDVIDPPMNRPSKFSFGLPTIQSNQEQKPHFQSGNKFGHLQQHVHQIQVNSMQHSLTCNPNKPSIASMKPYYGNHRSLGIEKVTTVESTTALYSIQPQNYSNDYYNAYEQIPSSVWSVKSQSLEQNLFDHDLQSSQRNLVVGTGSAMQMWSEESNSLFTQGDFPLVDATNLGNFESCGWSDEDQFPDVTPHLFETLNFDCEYPSESMKYPVIDQGLFA